jgi:hypothetical protein
MASIPRAHLAGSLRNKSEPPPGNLPQAGRNVTSVIPSPSTEFILSGVEGLRINSAEGTPDLFPIPTRTTRYSGPGC